MNLEVRVSATGLIYKWLYIFVECFISLCFHVYVMIDLHIERLQVLTRAFCAF